MVLSSPDYFIDAEMMNGNILGFRRKITTVIIFITGKMYPIELAKLWEKQHNQVIEYAHVPQSLGGKTLYLSVHALVSALKHNPLDD